MPHVHVHAYTCTYVHVKRTRNLISHVHMHYQGLMPGCTVVRGWNFTDKLVGDTIKALGASRPPSGDPNQYRSAEP